MYCTPPGPFESWPPLWKGGKASQVERIYISSGIGGTSVHLDLGEIVILLCLLFLKVLPPFLCPPALLDEGGSLSPVPSLMLPLVITSKKIEDPFWGPLSDFSRKGTVQFAPGELGGKENNNTHSVKASILYAHGFPPLEDMHNDSCVSEAYAMPLPCQERKNFGRTEAR